MATKLFYQLRNSVILSLLFLLSSYACAGNPVLHVLDHTIEEARISVTTGGNETKGTLKAHLISCSANCDLEGYHFDNTTVLINPMGAERPIKELNSWSGSRAMFRYSKSDNHVQTIHILP
jgi:hypothetical protein